MKWVDGKMKNIIWMGFGGLVVQRGSHIGRRIFLIYIY
jgi:hypothetical protein